MKTLSKMLTGLILVAIVFCGVGYYFFVYSYIAVGKNACPENYPYMTYSNVFKSFFDKPSWKKTSTFGNTIEFSGEKNEVIFKMYFDVDKKVNKTELTNLEINGNQQDEYIKNFIIISIFNTDKYDISNYENAETIMTETLEYMYKEYIPNNIVRKHYAQMLQDLSVYNNPLELSNMPKLPDVTLPNLTGMSLAAAKEELGKLNLEYVIHEEQSTKSAGTVFETVPEPGSKVNLEGYVILYVSSGKEEVAVDISDTPLASDPLSSPIADPLENIDRNYEQTISEETPIPLEEEE